MYTKSMLITNYYVSNLIIVSIKFSCLMIIITIFAIRSMFGALEKKTSVFVCSSARFTLDECEVRIEIIICLNINNVASVKIQF